MIFNVTGGTVATLGLTTGGKFYSSVPSVTISHPGTSFASATIGIAGSSVNPGSIAFSTTGRAYTTAPTVAISTSSGQDAPTQVAVGIATIHPITGIVTAVSFNFQMLGQQEREQQLEQDILLHLYCPLVEVHLQYKQLQRSQYLLQEQ